MFSAGDVHRRSSSNVTGGAGGSSDLFIKLALDQLSNAKESKKIANFKDIVQNASQVLSVQKHSANGNLDVAIPGAYSADDLSDIFAPFQTACQSKQSALIIISIDCLSKLFTYNYWAQFMTSDKVDVKSSEFQIEDEGKKDGRDGDDDDIPAYGTPGQGIMNLVIDTICDCFTGGDSTDEKVQLHIIKVSETKISMDLALIAQRW